MTVDDKTLRGVAPGSLIGPFSSAEINAAEVRLAEVARLEAVAEAAEIKAGWLAVNARAGGATKSVNAPAKPDPHGWGAIAAKHNAPKGLSTEDDAKAGANHGWGRFLPDET